MKEYQTGNDSELQKIAVWDRQSTKWVVFIHGGAWRDEKMTLHDGDNWMSLLPVSAAALSYRLSPVVQHPDHLADVLQGLEYLVENWQVDEIVLVGHSCGAFLALQVLQSLSNKRGATLDKISKVVAVEPILSLPVVVEEDSSYAEFVRTAFGDDPEFWKTVTPGECVKPLIVVHSTEDELLNIKYQPKAAEKIRPDVQLIKTTGTHNEGIQSRKFLDIIKPILET